jgi:hypothetical protein
MYSDLSSYIPTGNMFFVPLVHFCEKFCLLLFYFTLQIGEDSGLGRENEVSRYVVAF